MGSGTGCIPDATTSPSTDDSYQLYLSDVAALSQLDSTLFQKLDESGRLKGVVPIDHPFGRIFGGETAEDVAQYYSERIHYVLTIEEADSAQSTPDHFQNEGWQTPASQGQQNQSSGSGTSLPHGVRLGALNIGTGLWLNGLVNDTPVMVTTQHQVIPIDSSRVGLIMLGGGYAATLSDSSGKPHSIPAAYRQAILMHEGRHSDCTGGITEQEIELMRSSKSAEDYESKVPLPHCGHIHFTCHIGTFAGLPACDTERFGAYTVGAIYEAAFIDSQTDEGTKKLLQMSTVDYLSRYIGGGHSDDPDEKVPNMTSAGVLPAGEQQ